MRKTLKIFIFLILIICCFCSCSKSNVEQSSSNQNNTAINSTDIKETKVTILYGITYPNPDKRILEYNGTPIEISFNATNGPAKAEWGLRIFVNGYLQPFTVENEKSSDLFCFELNENQEFNFNFSFTPMVGNKDDELTVHFILYLNPSYVVTDDNYVGYDNNHDITQLLPWKLIMNADSSNEPDVSTDLVSYIEIPDVIEKELSNQYDENMEPINLLKENTFVDHFQTENNFNTINLKKSYFSTTIRGYGKAEKYRISLYVNHELVNAFDGSPYCIFDIKDDLLAQVSTNVFYEYKEKNNFAYIIAVPISETYNLYSSDVLKTNSMKIILE